MPTIQEKGTDIIENEITSEHQRKRVIPVRKQKTIIDWLNEKKFQYSLVTGSYIYGDPHEIVLINVILWSGFSVIMYLIWYIFSLIPINVL